MHVGHRVCVYIVTSAISTFNFTCIFAFFVYKVWLMFITFNIKPLFTVFITLVDLSGN